MVVSVLCKRNWQRYICCCIRSYIITSPLDLTFSQGGNATVGSTKISTGKYEVTYPVDITSRCAVIALSTGSTDRTVTFVYGDSTGTFTLQTRENGQLSDGNNVFYVVFGS